MIAITGILTKYTALKDKSFKIEFTSQELSPNDVQELHQMYQQFGIMTITEKGLSKEQIEAIESAEITEDKSKTSSKRLRSVLYLLFEQDNKGYSSFDNYYKGQMEEIINHFKNKIED